MIKFTATKNASVLSNLKGKVSKTTIGKIKQNGETLVGGEVCRMSKIVEIGDEIILKLPKKPQPKIVPYFCDIEIAFENDDMIILEKPAGMPTHTSKGNRETTLENAYLGMLAKRGEDLSNFTFHPITRLDGETSGLVLVAKNPVSAAVLSRDMQNGKIKKTYLAVANGKIKSDFTCEIKMGRLEAGKPHRWQTENGKNSVTHFKIIKEIHGDTLLEVTPQTGRTHQIRVHLAFLRHAIKGDKLYQNGGLLAGEKPNSRLMLHMWKLEMSGKVVESGGGSTQFGL